MLKRKREVSNFDGRWVVNLSTKDLTTPQKSVLSKGLNFAPAPRKIPIPQVVAAVEDGLRHVSDDKVANIRQRAIGLLKKAKPPPSNVTPEESRAIKELKVDPDILILPADKGRSSVVLDKSQYENKMSALLSDTSTYKVLSQDPTPSLQRKMNSQLLQLQRNGSLSIQQYNKLRCSSGLIPRIYGLPKIHKPDIPLRPIVSFCTSPTFKLSKYLAKLLSPLVGTTSSSVRNSRDFASFVQSLTLEETEVLVSFDVISLFTRVPVGLAIQVARQRLQADDTLSDRTSLDVEEVISLLSLCLNSTFFVFRGVFYQQVFGTAMGSPVSVVMANMVMEDIEDRALASFPDSPRFWKRYVDDVCCVVPIDQIDPLLQHLNSIESSIQFTYETESDDHSLPFLDILLMHCGNSILTSVYRKPTHTDRYLDFTSHHPSVHKAAVVKTLFSRADALSSSSTLIQQEHCVIARSLDANNYPRTFVSRHSRRGRSDTPSDDREIKYTIVLPYIRGFSEAVERMFSPEDVRVVHRPHTTLRQQLVHPKDRIPSTQNSDVIYSIPCSACPKVYIGQTGRLLGTRLKEHRAAVKYAKTDVSAVSEHVWEKHHQMDFQSTKILARENNLHRRCLLESWFIQKQHNCMNREIGTLAPSYVCLF